MVPKKIFILDVHNLLYYKKDLNVVKYGTQHVNEQALD